ncbi:MAG: MFS transporter [Chromatiaceae bacterium]|nr:MFS transporter [Chromatiaceae bacterium]
MQELSMDTGVKPAAYWAEYAGLMLIAMMGAAVTNLMPLIVGAFSDSGLFSTQQVGNLAAADVAGILLSTTSAFWWVRRVPWRPAVQLSLLLFIAANLFTSWAEGYSALLLLRFAAGVACGVSYAIALAALGDSSRVDKAFGVMVTIQVVFGTVGFMVLPELIGRFGYAAIYQSFNLFLLAALLLSFVRFAQNQKPQHSVRFELSGRLAPALWVFCGVVLYYFAQGGVWGYLERLGVSAGLTMAEVGYVLGLGFAVSAVGSLLSGTFVGKYGRSAALWLTVAVQLPCLLALGLLSSCPAWLIYAAATIVYQIFWSFVVPVMMGIFNDVDPSGRLIVFCLSAFKVGLMLGPPIAALTISTFSLTAVLPLGAVAIVLSALCLQLAQRRA